jgi:hypothetical protein
MLGYYSFEVLAKSKTADYLREAEHDHLVHEAKSRKQNSKKNEKTPKHPSNRRIFGFNS